MQKLHAHFLKLACAFLVLVCSWQVRAQTTPPDTCFTLGGLPDTFYACKNTRPLLPIPIISNTGGVEILDTLWSPRTTLTHPDSIATEAYVDLTSINYVITVRGRQANIARNPYFNLAGPGGDTVGFSTDYFLKVGSLDIQPGFFMVTDSPAKANRNFTNILDHTRTLGVPSNGNMLVVNGSTQPNKVVWRQVVSMKRGDTYELLAYGSSLTPLNTATLYWQVNGRVLPNASNHPLSLTPIVPQWSPMQVNYTKPATSFNTLDTVEIISTELSPDPGNDFALDDITIRPFCIKKDSVYVKAINLRPFATWNNILYGCTQDTVDFIGDTSATGGANVPPATVPDRYFWDFGDGQTSTLQSPRHIYTRRDTFRVIMRVFKDGVNPNGTITCVDSSVRVLDNRRSFYAGFKQDKDTLCKGDKVTLTDTSKPANLPIQYFFGTGDSTRLRNPDYTYDTAGTFEIAQVVIDTRDGCTDTARHNIVVIGPVDLSFSLTDSVICEGQTVRVKTLIDSSYFQYLWNFGDGRIVGDSTQVSQAYLTPGTYNVSFSAKHRFCPNVSATRPVIVLPTPLVNLGRDTVLCPTGQPILLQNLAIGNANTTLYKWSTGDETQQILVRHDGTYFLTATNSRGCSATDTIVITKNCFLDIPTVFTPNGDGQSDYFVPRQMFSKGLASFRMKIYNRWGHQIFETERLDGRGWDGKFNGVEQPVGVYLYFIEATLQNGMTEKYDGNVTLLR